MLRDFPCGPVAKISPSKAGSVGWISGQGTKSPHASGPKKKNQTASNRSNAVANVIKTLKFNKDFKNGPHQKIIIIIIIGIVRQEETPTPP